MKKSQYRVVRGEEVGKPNANFLVVNAANAVVGNDACSVLGFPTRKLAEIWKRRLDDAEIEGSN